MSREPDILIGQLRWKGTHVLATLDGLNEADLLRSLAPSGWNMADLVHHLTVDVERFWFAAVMAGDPVAVAYFESDPPDCLPDLVEVTGHISPRPQHTPDTSTSFGS